MHVRDVSVKRVTVCTLHVATINSHISVSFTFLGISPRNWTSFTGYFFTRRHTGAGYETNVSSSAESTLHY